MPEKIGESILSTPTRKVGGWNQYSTEDFEERILEALRKENRPMCISELEERTNISWETLKKYLERLVEKGLVEGKKVRLTRWGFRIKKK